MTADTTRAAMRYAAQLRAAKTPTQHSAVVVRLLAEAEPGVLLTVVDDDGVPIRLSALVGVSRNRLNDAPPAAVKPLPRRHPADRPSRYRSLK